MKENIKPTEILQNITPLLEKIVEENGLILLETVFVKEAGVWTLRMFIYRENGAITHEDCETVTRAVDKYVDEFINVPYRLEVSSPGLDRKLKSEKEYKIFSGKRVKIKLKGYSGYPERGTNPFLATIVGYNEEEGLTVKTLDTDETLTLTKDWISLIKLEPEF
jgi:ribosome maturation factor RimP